MIGNMLVTSAKNGKGNNEIDSKFEYFQNAAVPPKTVKASASGRNQGMAQKPPIAHAQSYQTL